MEVNQLQHKLITIHEIAMGMHSFNLYRTMMWMASAKFAKHFKLTIEKSINTLFTVNNSRPTFAIQLELRLPQRCVFSIRIFLQKLAVEEIK